jgi:predicted 2-oxoglutarate/Fe(II)-dependent dioxygenase YbiX
MVALGTGVFEIPGFLSPARCAELIADAEAIGFEDAGLGRDGQRVAAIRNNDRVVLRNPAWARELRERLWRHALPEIDGERAQDLAEYWRVYRYRPGQRFKVHRDGSVEERGMRSRLTFMIYLNEDCEGGETRFRDSEWDHKRGRIDVVPQTGKALLFLHERWHEGAAVLSGVKYALRTDLLYAREPV